MPALRLQRRARRPVRQLRPPARPGRPDRSALAHRRGGARVPRDEAPVPRPAGVQGRADRLDREAGALAPERAAVLAQLRQGAEAARDHARPRLGRADPGPRLRGAARQADLRLVRRGDRLPLRGGRVGRQHGRSRGLALLVAEPGLPPLLLHGQGQHRLPHGDLAEHPPRLRRGRRGRRRPRQARAAVQHRLERVPHPGGEEVRLQPRDRDPRARLPRPLRRRRAPLLPLDRRARRRRTPTSRGPSSSAATTTSSSRPGGTSSTARSRAPTGRSAPSPSPARFPQRTRCSSPRSTAASRPSAA